MKLFKKLALIPARGGSKRIPRKNIKEFLGRPIISYSINAALDSKLFDEVMVSTDDKEIAEISKKENAIIPFYRSKENSNDYATTAEVIKEVVMEYEKMGKIFDIVCCIYPANPFLTPELLIKSFNFFIEKDADSVLPIVQYSHPIDRALRIRSDGRVEFRWKEYTNRRSQDIESSYHDAGQFYWLKTSLIKEATQLVSKNTYPYLLSESEVQDIDNFEDWKLAEIKANIRKNYYDKL